MVDLFWIAVAVGSAPPWISWVAGAAMAVVLAVPVWLWRSR